MKAEMDSTTTIPMQDHHVDIFGGIKIIPVPPEHPCAPAPGTLNVDGEEGHMPSVCYVLEAEYPAVRAALLRKIQQLNAEPWWKKYL